MVIGIPMANTAQGRMVDWKARRLVQSVAIVVVSILACFQFPCLDLDAVGFDAVFSAKTSINYAVIDQIRLPPLPSPAIKKAGLLRPSKRAFL